MNTRKLKEGGLWWMLMGLGLISYYFFSLDTPLPRLGSREPCFTITTYGLRGPVEWAALPRSVQDDFTLGGQIKVEHAYFNSSVGEQGGGKNYSRSQLEELISKAAAHNPSLSPYGSTASVATYTALASYPVKGKHVLVIGTQVPWIEAALVAAGARTTTVRSCGCTCSWMLSSIALASQGAAEDVLPMAFCASECCPFSVMVCNFITQPKGACTCTTPIRASELGRF